MTAEQPPDVDRLARSGPDVDRLARSGPDVDRLARSGPDVDRLARSGPDVDRLARSMLQLHGAHEDDHPARDDDDAPVWAKAPDFANNPARAAAVHAATGRDRDRYLSAGLSEVDCRFCHASVRVKKLGAPFTAVQWTASASERCAYFAEIRAGGGSSARVPSCPRLTDSIRHAVAEGCLEEYSSAPAPGDG